MVDRPVLTEPVEAMAVDLIGPLPKAKGGFRFVLTTICMASRWPEAVPLKNISARNIAEGLISILSHMAIPLTILSDQGSRFTGKLMKQLCSLLGIQPLKTTAYHPQTMHATLEATLTKAHSQKLDWSQQLPFALFYLKQAPNRDTLLSPYEVVFGRQVRTPLELMYHEWATVRDEPLDVCTWVHSLHERLELVRDVVRQRL